ncbi:MAG: Na/Pi cotransporter family protein [Planctomycetota bacterium]|jgi:phosphate:Na+ symporter
MVKDMIFGVVGGLGLFLFGMGLMSDGLKKIAGQQLRNILESLTRHRVIALLIGAGITALVQSSSAATVMTVGFVNAGLLTLKQALCVILGANIGTTFTAWLVSIMGTGLKITAYALPAAGVGFLLQVAGRTRKVKSIGTILLGFGLLFLGIGFMKDAFGPLKESGNVQQVLIHLGQKPILAVMAGTAITMLLQSSSASIMIIQVLALQGAFGTDWSVALSVAIPFILGDNIGTTITAQIAALRTNRNARRAAMGHTIFNIAGVIYMLPIIWLGWYADAIEWITPFKLSESTIMVYIAIAHSAFNIFNAIIFLPVIYGLEKIVIKLIPVREEEKAQEPVVLEQHLLNTPTIALEQAEREIIRMARTAREALEQAVNGILSDDRKLLDSVRTTEDFIDNFQLEITGYLTELSSRQLSRVESAELPVLLHSVNDLERIGDHAVNIIEIAERKIEQKLSFSDSALAEISQLRREIEQMFDATIASLENRDVDSARAALVNEKNLNQLQLDFRRSHVERMTEGVCTAMTGLIFIDLVDNVEKIGDHLTNIAQAVIGGLRWDGVEEKDKPETDS